MNNLIKSDSTFQFVPKDFNEAMKFCEMIAQTDFCPKEYRGKPGACFVAMQFGAEVGLKPLQALQGIATINGKPSIYGDHALALVRCHSDYEWKIEKEILDQQGKIDGAICTIKRKGEDPCIRKFTIDDAKKAQLWGKAGPWTNYPNRMLQMRARGFALRDSFPDALKGLILAEEASDYPQEKNITSLSEVTILNPDTKIGALAAKLKGDTKKIENKPEVNETKVETIVENNESDHALDAYTNSIYEANTLEELEKIGLTISQSKELNTEQTKQIRIVYGQRLKALKEEKGVDDFVKDMDGE